MHPICATFRRHFGHIYYGAILSLGDNRYENGGFVVRFYGPKLLDCLAEDFDIEEVTELKKGEPTLTPWANHSASKVTDYYKNPCLAS
ncbi:hypothetical protein SAMN02745225_01944 [Ferrithrix thermotolerans DSM 19514]|uniref:Uncharacterized protein n=1 Tax=Ferrithrix thermotolerans DSM 19514 TaxID=1121881 RepID=A0A1M4X8T6_9ACTN|nr:hypothetical protein SAMN02745225_01944 [Ferrithrix thermotolerans DSM 19514]